MIQFPQADKKFLQSNRGDTIGNLAWTNNIDLQTRLGRIRVSPRLLKASDSTDSGLSGLGCPVGFRFFGNTNANGGDVKTLWTVAGSEVFYNSSDDYTTFTAVSAGTYTLYPTDCSSDYSDIEVFTIGANPCLVVTSSDKIYYLAPSVSAWANISGLTVGSVGTHMMTTYGNRLYVTDNGNKILSVASGTTTLTGSGSYTFTFPANEFILWIRSTTKCIWIGTINKNNQKGTIYEWDGASSTVTTASHRLEARAPLSCVIQNDVPFVMDSDGVLLFYSGGDFREVEVGDTPMGRLPTNGKLLSNAHTLTTNNRFIHPNGMTILNKKILMLINGIDEDGGDVETLPSGIWTFDPSSGLTHTASVSYKSTTNSITDFGQNRLSRVGALSEAKVYDASNASRNGQLVVGADIYSDATTVVHGVYYDDTNDTIQKAGYFVTTKIDAPEITDVWQKVFLQYRQLLNSSDKIVAKYRTTENEPTEMTITWTSTTTFTTTDVNMANYAVGDEVEVTQGKGSGLCSHITVISNVAGTYTVTVDETYTGATSGTAKARFQKWIKIPTIVNDQISSFKELPLGPSTTWIQFKICMLFTGKDQFEYFYLVSTRQQKAQ